MFKSNPLHRLLPGHLQTNTQTHPSNDCSTGPLSTAEYIEHYAARVVMISQTMQFTPSQPLLQLLTRPPVCPEQTSSRHQIRHIAI